MNFGQRLFLALFIALVLPIAAFGQTGQWNEIASLPTPRAFPAVAVLGGQIYVIGGQNANGQPLDVVERYNPTSNTWSTVDELRNARFNASATVYNGEILLTGGREDSGVTDDVEVYDPVDQRWESFESLRDEREGHQVFVVGNDVYVCGGLDTLTQYRTDGEIYDGSSESWEDYGPWVFSPGRAAFAAIPDGMGVLIFGGFGSVGPVADVEFYVPDQPGVNRANMPTPRGGLASAKKANRLWAIGGRNSLGDVVARVDAYDANSDEWESGPALPEARLGAVAAEVGDRLFVFGGQNGASQLLSTSLELVLMVANEPATPATEFTLDLAVPNPFTSATTFTLRTPTPLRVTISVYDVLGRRVALLYNGQIVAGSETITWDGTDDAGRELSTGSYFVRASDGEHTAVRRITRLR